MHLTQLIIIPLNTIVFPFNLFLNLPKSNSCLRWIRRELNKFTEEKYDCDCLIEMYIKCLRNFFINYIKLQIFLDKLPHEELHRPGCRVRECVDLTTARQMRTPPRGREPAAVHFIFIPSAQPPYLYLDRTRIRTVLTLRHRWLLLFTYCLRYFCR